MKKNLAALLAAAALCLAGCSPGGIAGTGTAASNRTTAVSAASAPHYEEKVRLPDEMRGVLDMRLTEGGELLVAAADEHCTQAAVFAQADDGTWEEAFSADELMSSLSEGSSVSGAALTPQGSLLCVVSPPDGSGAACYMVERDGSFSRSSFSIGYAHSLRVLEDGSVIAARSGGFGVTAGGLDRYNAATGDKAAAYDLAEGEFPVDFAVHEDTLYVSATRSNGSRPLEAGLVAFDVQTGARLDVDPSLGAAFDQVLPAADASGLPASPALASGFGGLYACSNGAVYRLANGTAECVLDGSDTHLENSAQRPEGLLLLSDGGLAVRYRDASSPEGSAYCYFEGERARTAELTVYALEDNPDVQQAVAAFRDERPEVDVELQVGIPADSGLTADDAIRALNAELLSGSGPDLLVLDGLPIEALIEQGMLLDLEDDVRKVLAGGSYYENVLTAFSGDDGCFAVPTRFAFPAMVGDRNVLNHAGSLEELAAYLDASDETRGQLSTLSLTALYTASYPAIMGEDGAVDAEALKTFFEGARQLFSIAEGNVGEGPDPSLDYVALAFERFGRDSFGLSGYSLLGTDNRLEIGSMVDVNDFGMAGIAVSNADYPCAIAPLAFGGVQTFEPRTVAGISAESENADDARDMLAFLLSKERQATGRDLGLPVLKSVFDENAQACGGYGMSSMDAGGSATTFERGALSEDEVVAFHRMVEGATVPCLFDKVVTDVIATELEACCRGTVSLEDAVGNAMQKIALYQAQ